MHGEAVPEVIATTKQHTEATGRLADLVRKGRDRTLEESRLMKLVAVLVQDYDRHNSLPPAEASPGEIVRYLLRQSGKRTADLLPIFGQRSHVSEAINGRRRISAEQARKLGKLFNVNPGMFVQ